MGKLRPDRDRTTNPKGSIHIVLEDSTAESGFRSYWIYVDDILAAAQLRSEKNLANGYVGLDSDGKINPIQLPAIAITNTYPRASQAEMLALDVTIGSVCVRSDISKSFVLRESPASVLANWNELLGVSGVASFNGRVGTVTPQSNDYTTDQIQETLTRVFVTPELLQKLIDLSATTTDINAFHKTTAGEINALPDIETITDASVFLGEKSSLFGKVKITYLKLKTKLKSYLDDYYAAINHNHSALYEPKKGNDDNFITDIEKTNIGNLSGVNSGDQVADQDTILGIGTINDPLRVNPAYQGGGSGMNIEGTNSNIDFLNFDPETTHILTKSQVGWNKHDMTLNIKANDDVTLQVNQEQTIPVINLSGSQMDEGTFFRIVGFDDVTGYNYILPSSNDSEASAIVDGMLTQTLPNHEEGVTNGIGLGTTKGFVREISTVEGIEGAIMYLGINGLKTATKPTYPAKVVVCGKYSEIGASGSVYVDTSSSYQTVINDINTELSLKANQNVGICAKCPILVNDIVIDTTALTLTIATIKGGETISDANPIRFFIDGDGEIEKFEKAVAQTVSFTNTTAKWFFYFDANGDLVSSVTPWSDFNTIAPVFRFDWDSALSGAARLIEELPEYHTNTISADDHAHKHAGGTINLHDSGLLIRNELTTGAPNVDGRNTVISLTDVENMDDNLTYEVRNVHPATAAYYFEQDLGYVTAGGLTLSNSALLPIRTNSAGGQRSFLPATRFPFAWDTATNRPEYITSAGVRTLVPDDNYFVYYIYSIQDRKIGQAVRLVSAEVSFATLTLARAHSIETLQGLYADMRDNEIRPLYKLIFLANNAVPSAFNVAVKYTRLHQTVDIRKTKGVAVTSSSGSMPATNVTETVDGNVQTALDNVRISAAFEVYGLAISDEATALTTGNAKITDHWPYNFTAVSVFIGLSVNSTSGSVIVDVNDDAGNTVFSTRPTVLANEDNSLTNPTQPVLVTTTFLKGDKCTYDIDLAGTGAKGVKIKWIGYRS